MCQALGFINGDVAVKNYADLSLVDEAAKRLALASAA